ncbi:MAG: hypothetical protein MRY78_15955 [Saprospiraceae bacterium]|nr:hypothetical protein [Saprospiraceae bacterium]
MNWSEQIDRIEDKMLRLAQQFRHLKVENEALRQQLQQKENTISVLTQKLENSQRILAKEQGKEEQDTKMLMQQIDQYIEELDKCIEWLHKI